MEQTDHDAIIRIEAYTSHMKEIIDKMDRTLHGNGSEGLCTTMQKHALRITAIEDTRKERDRTILILVGIIVSVGMFFMTVLNYLRI